MYKLLIPKLPSFFETVPNFVTTALKFMNSMPMIKPVVELYEEVQVPESRQNQENPVSSLMKRSDIVFSTATSHFRDSAYINITIS